MRGVIGHGAFRCWVDGGARRDGTMDSQFGLVLLLSSRRPAIRSHTEPQIYLESHNAALLQAMYGC
jgi:hypothetical protein